MADAISEAEVLVEVALKSGRGSRVVAATGADSFHVFKVTDPNAALAPELSFTAGSAVRLAELILAGDEHAMTLPGAERILAAALLVGRV